MAARKSAAGADTGFHEKSFFEYHLYTLGRRTSIPDRSTKQIELFAPALAVPCEKVLVYYGLAAGNRGWGPSPTSIATMGSKPTKRSTSTCDSRMPRMPGSASRSLGADPREQDGSHG